MNINFIKNVFTKKHMCPRVSDGYLERFDNIPYFKLYFKTALEGLSQKQLFKDVNAFCFFIGYERSGHSLIGALLDAHPNIVISHEADVLGLVDAGFRRNQIFSFILHNSRYFAAKGRGWSGYSYKVSGQWQGKAKDILVIGDKKGMQSSLRLADDPSLYAALKKRINRPVKIIHHIRDPFDNIASIHRHRGEAKAKKEGIDYYFNLCAAVEKIKNSCENCDISEGRHEDFISDPKAYLRNLCAFLGVTCDEGYLNACAKIVERSPRQSRHQIEWDNELKDVVRDNIGRFDFLSPYKREDHF